MQMSRTNSCVAGNLPSEQNGALSSLRKITIVIEELQSYRPKEGTTAAGGAHLVVSLILACIPDQSTLI